MGLAQQGCVYRLMHMRLPPVRQFETPRVSGNMTHDMAVSEGNDTSMGVYTANAGVESLDVTKGGAGRGAAGATGGCGIGADRGGAVLVEAHGQPGPAWQRAGLSHGVRRPLRCCWHVASIWDYEVRLCCDPSPRALGALVSLRICCVRD